MYRRSLVDTLVKRIHESRRFIQMLIGPRQTGKSTAIKQALQESTIPYHIALATIGDASMDWLRAQWQQARNLITEANPSVLLVIDEIQLVTQWSGVVKELWDEDTWAERDVRVVLSGSSSVLIKKGLRKVSRGDSRSFVPRIGRIKNVVMLLAIRLRTFSFLVDILVVRRLLMMNIDGLIILMIRLLSRVFLVTLSPLKKCASQNL